MKSAGKRSKALFEGGLRVLEGAYGYSFLAIQVFFVTKN
jgi:hypothetical protein